MKEFLAPANLMDYSLLLGIKDIAITGKESQLREAIDVDPTSLGTRGVPFL